MNPSATIPVSPPEPGHILPARTLPLTVQRLVMAAAANRDFAPIHHDDAAGRAAGSPGMFANFVFIQSVYESLLRGWIGQSGRIERVRIRLQGFNVAGTTLTTGGEVTRVEAVDGGYRVEIDAWTRSDGELTSTGAATVRWVDGL